MARRVHTLVLLGAGLLVCAAVSLVSGGEPQGANQSPTANAGPNLSGIVGQAITLDGSGSTDPDGTIALYRWEQVFPTKTGRTYVTSNPVSLQSPASGVTSFTPQWPGNYRFRLTVVDNAGAASSSTVDVAVAYSQNPLSMRGVAITHAFVLDDYNADWLLSTLKRLRVNSVTISPDVFMPSRTSNRVVFLDSSGSDPGGRTMSDESLERLIELCHGNGIAVVLKPMLIAYRYAFDRPEMHPTNWSEWFASYQTMINHYAAIAEDNNVELLCIGTENWTTESQERLWRATISGVRGIYHGEITYEASSIRFEGNQWDVKFWDALDYIGVSGYFEGSGTERDPTGRLEDPTLEQMKSNIDRIYKATVEQVANRFSKRVLLIEAGCNNANWGNCSPWMWTQELVRSELGKQFEVDYGEQSTYYEAMLEVAVGHPELEGVFWWALEEGCYSCPMDLSVTSNPVSTLLPIWYGDGK